MVNTLRDRKQVVYIWFEDIKGYSYKYIEDPTGKDKFIRIHKEGRFSYISWKLDIDRDNIQKFDRSFTVKFDRVSQYWIVNNFAGLRIELNPKRPDNYEINVVKEVGDSIYVYISTQFPLCITL